MSKLTWISERLQVELGIPVRAVKVRGTDSGYIAVDARRLKRHMRRRVKRPVQFTKAQLEYGCRMVIQAYLNHDPRELFDTNLPLIKAMLGV